MCRCTARGGCESERGARVRNRGRMKGSRRKPAISYAKQSGNTPCMHTASPEPRSKIIEHGPFHRKVAWKGRRTDFSFKSAPSSSCNVFFRIVSRGIPFQPFPEIRRACARAPRATIFEQSRQRVEFKWMDGEIRRNLFDLDDSLIIFFFFIIDLGERRKRKEILFQGYRG